MVNFILNTNLSIKTKKFNTNEIQLKISGFQRAYGFSILGKKIFIPDFISGLIYELDIENKKTKILKRNNTQLNYLSTFERIKIKLSSKRSIIQPHDIYIDDKSNFYITEMGPGRKKGKGKVLVFDKNFNLIKEIGLELHNNFGLISPVMTKKIDNIFYVSEFGSNKILRFNNNFEFIDWIGEIDDIYTEIKKNSWSTSRNFININLLKPHAVEVGPDNNIYIADTGNHRILKFSINGDFKGWVGKNKNGKINDNWSTAGQSTKGDQLGAFNEPLDLVFKDDFIYVSEVGNNRIVKLGLDGKSYGWIGINEEKNKFIWTKDISKKVNLNNPYGLKIKNNVVYIANRFYNEIIAIDSLNLF